MCKTLNILSAITNFQIILLGLLNRKLELLEIVIFCNTLLCTLVQQNVVINEDAELFLAFSLLSFLNLYSD